MDKNEILDWVEQQQGLARVQAIADIVTASEARLSILEGEVAGARQQLGSLTVAEPREYLVSRGRYDQLLEEYNPNLRSATWHSLYRAYGIAWQEAGDPTVVYSMPVFTRTELNEVVLKKLFVAEKLSLVATKTVINYPKDIYIRGLGKKGRNMLGSLIERTLA